MSTLPTYIDLFSGCGGISVGLQQAGFKGLFAIERNQDAFTTLKTNLIDAHTHFHWPSWLELKNWDIREVIDQKRKQLRSLRGKVDLIVGGPPCQGFSMAGRRREEDQRNQLVHSYLEFVDLVRPEAILFENVMGFSMKFRANPCGGVSYAEIVTGRLGELGYTDATAQVIDTSHFGVPQRRQRFLVIATRSGRAGSIFPKMLELRSKFLTKKGISLKNSTQSALSDLEKVHGTVPCADSPRFRAGIAAKPVTGLQKYLRKGNRMNPPDSHRYVNHTPRAEQVFSKLLNDAPRNKSISGRDREASGLRKRSVTVLCPNSPSPTITTIPDDFVHYSEARVMTVRECARLQTFPDWFKFTGAYTTGGKLRVSQAPRYTQVGNAVPPLLAELIGIALKTIIK